MSKKGKNEFEVKILKPEDYCLWDQLVNDSSVGTIFHHSFWLEANGMPFEIYGCFKNGNLVGGMPLCLKKKIFNYKIGMPPPLTPYLNIVTHSLINNNTKKQSFCRKISESIIDYLKKNYLHVQFKISMDELDLIPFLRGSFDISVKITYILSLDNIDFIWRNLHVGKRTDIRNALRKRFEVRENVEPNILFDLVEKTYQRQRKNNLVSIYGRNYYTKLREHNCGRNFVVFNSLGEPLGGIYIVWDRNKSYYLTGGYDHNKNEPSAVAFALWHAIRFSKEKLGLRYFDFEGSQAPNLETFFRRFGGTQVPYYRVSWSTRPIRIARELKKITSIIFST